MDEVLLIDAPAGDREEIERYIENYGGAFLLRCNGKIGHEGHAEFVRLKKANGYQDPPHDFVWVMDSTLGRESSAAAVDGAGSVTRSGHHEAVGERQGRQPAQELRAVERELRSLHLSIRLHLWWGGVMVGCGVAFAMKHGWWPSWAALICGGLLFTWQGRDA